MCVFEYNCIYIAIETANWFDLLCQQLYLISMNTFIFYQYDSSVNENKDTEYQKWATLRALTYSLCDIVK